MPPRTPATDPSLAALGEAISLLRRKAGLTQEGLAEKADVHPTWISRMEQGARNPTLASLGLLSKGLGVRLSDLIALAEALDR